jgi:hypothetical protein
VACNVLASVEVAEYQGSLPKVQGTEGRFPLHFLAACADIIALIHGFSDTVGTAMRIFDEKVRCHNGYNGVINLKTKDGGNTGLSYTQLQQLRGMAAKPGDVKQFSYR